MAAETDMTIVIRARDATAGVLKTIGTRIKSLFLAPLTLVGRAIESIYKRFFSLKNLLVGGGAIALLLRGVSSVSSGEAQEFEPLFGKDTQKNIDKVQGSINRLLATLKGLFGRNIANASDDLTGFFDSISDFLDRHAESISHFFQDAIDFFREAAKFLRAVGSGNVKAGDLVGLLNLFDRDKAQGRVREGLRVQEISDAYSDLADTFEKLKRISGKVDPQNNDFFGTLRDTAEAMPRLAGLVGIMRSLGGEYEKTANAAQKAALAQLDLAEKTGNEGGGVAAAMEAANKVIAQFLRGLEHIPSVVQRVQNYIVQLTEVAGVFARSVTDGFIGIVQGTQSVAQAFKSMVASILEDLGRLLVERSLLSLFGSLLGLTNSQLGLGSGPFSGSGFFGSLFGQNSSGIGHRAAGGPVSRGKGYVVGENGPEFFQPNQNGTIIPNGAGGSYAVHNHFHGRSDPKEVERATGRALMKLLQSNGSVRSAIRSA